MNRSKINWISLSIKCLWSLTLEIWVNVGSVETKRGFELKKSKRDGTIKHSVI
jgi:hypothetical protein